MRLRQVSILAGGRVGGYLLSFIRNLVIARMLAKVDYGLAAAFATTVTTLEIAGRLGISQYIVQAEEGDSDRAERTAHVLQCGAGLVGALMLLIVSPFMARAFGAPSAVGAFAALAIIPLLKGLEHLDSVRQQRSMQFRAVVLIEIIPQAVTTLLTLPLVYFYRSYWAVVGLLALRGFASLVTTHLLAGRVYAWEWHRDSMRAMLRFGTPLLASGLVMILSQQADQLLVGGLLSLEQLANYSLAVSLVGIPWFVFAHVMSSVMLPVLARSKNDRESFQRQYTTCLEYATGATLILTLPLIVGGEQIVTRLYGQKYASSGGLVAVLGVACALRFMRYGAALTALAQGDAMNQFYANLWRAASLPLAFLALALGGSALSVAACAATGEIVATIASLWLLAKRRGIPLSASAKAYVFFLGCLVFAAVLICLGVHHWTLAASGAAVAFLFGCAVIVAIRVFPDTMAASRRLAAKTALATAPESLKSI